MGERERERITKGHAPKRFAQHTTQLEWVHCAQTRVKPKWVNEWGRLNGGNGERKRGTVRVHHHQRRPLLYLFHNYHCKLPVSSALIRCVTTHTHTHTHTHHHTHLYSKLFKHFVTSSIDCSLKLNNRIRVRSTEHATFV